MKKVAVLVDHGFEECETLITVDIMRRADINCHIVSFTDNNVQGANKIVIRSDLIFQNADFSNYDMIIILSGFTHKESVLSILDYYNHHNKWIALMGNSISLINTKPLIGEALFSVNNTILLNKGYATTYTFIYHCLELLGVDSEPIKTYGLLQCF